MVVFDRALPYGTKKSSPTKPIQVELDGTFNLKSWNPKFEAFKDGLHPRKLTWNLKMNPWKRRFQLKPSFSGSMLILGGVPFFILF